MSREISGPGHLCPILFSTLIFILSFSATASAWLLEADSISLPAVSSGSTTFQTVTFRQPYSAPPLIFLLPAHENPEPTALRIRNITNTTFELVQVEPPGEDAVQPATTAHYMAIEAGVHQLPNGTVIEAGSLQTTNLQHGSGVAGAEAWSSVSLTTTFAANPAVLAEVQTMANVVGNPPGAVSVPWLTASVQAVGTTSLQLALELSEVNDASGGSAVIFNETIAYLAVNSSMAGTFSDNLGTTITYETIHTPLTVRGWGDGCYQYGFTNAYISPPLVIAHANTHNGGDGGWLRRCAAVNNSDIRITIDEDQDQNTERNHTTEEAGILVFSQAFDADIYPAPIADYHFDECDLTGGIVADTVAGLNGSVNGLVTTVDDTGGICKVGEFSGGTIELSSLPVSTTAGDRTTVMFWMYWDGTTNVMPFGWNRHDLWLNNNHFGFNTANSDIYGISNATATLANGWHHIAAVFVNGNVSQDKLYIDGVAQTMSQQQGSPVNSRAYVQASARISGWLGDNGYRFSGKLDEVMIHNGELSAVHINTVMNNQLAGNNYDGSARSCDLCLNAQAEYHFNECLWNSTADEVQDSSNIYHGTAYGTSVSNTAQLCRSGDFTVNGITDYVSLNSSAANGLGDFSVSTWIKTANSGNQAILSGAGTNNNEMLMWLSNGTTFSPFINGGSTSIAIPNVADDIWHHLVWTRNGATNCVYVDNVSQGCGTITGKTNPVSINAGGLIVGQEQDSVGGSFDGNQDFEGFIDELKIYTKILNATEVNSLFNETTSSCGTCLPTASEWRFDECSWNGTAGEVVDQQGVNNGIRVGDAVPTTGGNLCNSGLFDGTGDYINMGDAFNTVFGNTSNSFTITAWIRPTNLTGAQTNHLTSNSFIAKASDPVNDNLEIGVNTNGTLHLYLDTRGSDSYADFGTVGDFALNSWNFVAVVYNAGTITVRINDSTYTDSTTWNSADTFIDNAAGSPFTVGASIHIDNFFTGNVDEVKVYSSALANPELTVIKDETRNTCGVCSTPVSDYRFDECDLSGGTVADSQSGNNGTINGAVASFSIGALCNSGNFSGGTVELTGLPISTTAGDRTTVIFWMKWDGSNNVMPFGWFRHDLWLVNDRFGFNTSSNDVYGISGAAAKLANNWHHVAAVFVNGSVNQAKLYIDGVPQAISQQQGTPNNGNAYVQANARISGWLADTNYRFSGQLDEVMIFNDELSAGEISSIYNNENSGANYDGSNRSCTLCTNPVAEYHLNECSWNGSANEVIDSGVNGYHGTASNSTTDPNGQICRSGNFLTNSITDYVDLDYRAANGLGDFTLSLWVKTTNPSNQQQAIFSGAGASDNEMLLFLPNNTTLSPYINGGSGSVAIPSIADNNWHHIAWTRSGVQNCIYLDNVARGCVNLTGKTNPLVIGSGGLILGQEQDSVGGGFTSTQDFEGYIDQVKIFDTVLGSGEINILYNESSSGCNVCNIPAADWHFDECSPAATIADSSGNGFGGITQGNTDTIGPGTLCRTGNFDGAGDYVDMGDIFNNIFGTTNSNFTLTTWLYPTALTAAQTNHQTRNTFAAKASDPFNDNLEIGINQNGTVHLYMDTAGANTYTDFGTAGDVVINSWNFVAVSYDGNTVRTTINGTTYANSATWSGGGNFRDATGSPFTLGASIHIDNFFSGQIDETQLYDSVLSPTDLQVLRNNYLAGKNYNGSSRTCPNCGGGVDHYEIRHDGTALTCNPEDITVIACQDSGCTTLYSGAVSLTLTSTGNTSAQVDNTALSFSGGSTTFQLHHTTPEVVILSINSPTPLPANTSTCLNTTTSTASCDITYHESGFIFDVPTPQTSCQSSVAVTISAVRMNLTTQQCVPGFISRTENIGFWSTYLSPATGSQQVSINGTSIATSSPGTNISLLFDNNGQSTFTASYEDAGDMQINTSFAGTGAESGLIMLGNDTFTVKPDRFVIRAYDTSSNDLDGSVTWAASDPFNFDITATCANGTTVTHNYTPTGNDRIRIRVERTNPTGINSQDRIFTIDGLDITDSTAPVYQDAQVAAASFTNGSFTDNGAAYNDVGQLNITIQDNNYFGQTFASPAGGLPVGRFIPHHFDVTTNAPILSDGCGTGNFTYLGDTFGYFIEPSVTITAQDTANNTTVNYEGSLWKLGEPFSMDYTYTDNTGVAGLSPLSNTYTATAGATSNCNGTLTATISETFSYPRPAVSSPQAPFGANMDLDIDVAELIDTDLVCYKTGVPCLGLNIGAITGTSLRHGRLKVFNNYGPETRDITNSPFEIQHYDGTNWIINTDENDVTCTTEVSLGFCAEGTHTSTVDAGTLSAGAGTLTVTTTSAVETVRACPTAPSSLTSLAGCGATNDLCGDFTFGLFRGNDRLINWQEIVR